MFLEYELQQFFEVLLRLALILILSFVIVKLINLGIKRWRAFLGKDLHVEELDCADRLRRLDTLTSLVRKGLKIVTWSVAFLMILQNLGIEIAPLLASAGILGLAVGFGAQSLVQDIISGFFILFEDQIRVGDVVNINGTGGLVENINFRTVILRDLTGTVHVFRNGSINTTANMTKGWSAVVLDIGVAYKENIARVMEVMKQVCEGMREDEEYKDLILEEMEVFGLDNFADSALVIKGRIKTYPLQQWFVGREYRKRLKEAFDKEGIEIPFPHRSIYFGEASKAFMVQTSKS